MLPRLVVRVRKAVRRVSRSALAEEALSGPEIEARWDAMMHHLRERDREAERRLERAAEALNRLTFD